MRYDLRDMMGKGDENKSIKFLQTINPESQYLEPLNPETRCPQQHHRNSTYLILTSIIKNTLKKH